MRIPVLALLAAALAAGEAPPPAAEAQPVPAQPPVAPADPGATPAAPAAPAAASNWTWKTKLGAFFANTASHNAETSRDPAISSTSDSVSYRANGEATVVWKEDKDRVEQKLELGYGQIRTEDTKKWTENLDSILYSATYERTLTKPQFMYANATGESVFTGKEPDEEPLDPLIAKASVGYGHRYENMLPEQDALVWRVGVYAKKRWETGAAEYQTELETGPEVYLRYERKQSEDINYFAQYEAYSEFDDIEHVTNLAQAGLSVKVAKLLTVEVKARAYYESRPDEAPQGTPGYSEWSVRQEALVGLVWETGSGP